MKEEVFHKKFDLIKEKDETEKIIHDRRIKLISAINEDHQNLLQNLRKYACLKDNVLGLVDWKLRGDVWSLVLNDSPILRYKDGAISSESAIYHKNERKLLVVKGYLSSTQGFRVHIKVFGADRDLRIRVKISHCEGNFGPYNKSICYRIVFPWWPMEEMKEKEIADGTDISTGDDSSRINTNVSFLNNIMGVCDSFTSKKIKMD